MHPQSQPSGPHLKRVEHVVLRCLAPAVKLDHRRPVWPIVTIFIGNKQHVRRRANPHAAETQLNPREIGPLVVENRPPVEPAVIVSVFEDQDPVPAGRTSQPDWIRVILDNPQPPLVIDGHRDRLDDVGLGRELGDREALGNLDPRRCLFRGYGRICGRRSLLELRSNEVTACYTKRKQVRRRPPVSAVTA